MKEENLKSSGCYHSIEPQRENNRRELKNKDNIPDIGVKNYKRKTYFLIDMSVPTDNNITVKEFNKINKFKDQEIEIEKTHDQ